MIVLPVLFMMLLFAACGDENGEGSGGSLFSGFSLIVILIVGFFVVRHFMKKKG